MKFQEHQVTLRICDGNLREASCQYRDAEHLRDQYPLGSEIRRIQQEIVDQAADDLHRRAFQFVAAVLRTGPIVHLSSTTLDAGSLADYVLALS